MAGAVLAKGGAAEAARSAAGEPKHLAWVWQFNDDGPRDAIRRVLSQNGLGVVLKTHDGTSWMSRWDESSDAVRGPADIRNLASYFESNGIPFHAWCVVKGLDPAGEAQMCAEALASGARSMVLDLEPDDGGHYWQGGPAEAVVLGRELRRLAPMARISVAPDPRPWQVKEVPMAEFAAFCDEIAPQTYWKTFNSAANFRLLREHGFNVGPEGVTPELILDVTAHGFARFNRPIRPIGQGAADLDGWRRFVQHAYRLGMQHVSVWRYGTAAGDVWPVLREMAPARSAPPTPSPIPGASSFPSYRLSTPDADKDEADGARTAGDGRRDARSGEESKDQGDDQSTSSNPRVKETGLFGTKGVSSTGKKGRE